MMFAEYASIYVVKIAYVVRNGFHPPFNGERVKSAALATALARCGSLHVLDLGRADYAGTPYPNGEILSLPYGGEANIYSLIVSGHASNLRKQQQALKEGRRPRLSRMPLFRRRAAQRLIAQLKPDVVVVDHPLLAPLAIGSGAPLRVVHAHNVESRLAKSLVETTNRLRARFKAYRRARAERELLSQLDQVWAVSEEDAQAYRDMGILNVAVAPNIIPDHAFAQTPSPGTPGHAAFFGWLAYPPNAEALDYLIGLCERLPELKKLTVIGKGLREPLAERLRRQPKIHYAGYVESIEAATVDACAILVPMQHGAGTKLKVIEALALGKPLITTPVGAEGLSLQDGRHAVIRELGPAFDEACQRALSHPEKNADCGRQGQLHARALFSQQSLNLAVRTELKAQG